MTVEATANPGSTADSLTHAKFWCALSGEAAQICRSRQSGMTGTWSTGRQGTFITVQIYRLLRPGQGYESGVRRKSYPLTCLQETPSTLPPLRWLSSGMQADNFCIGTAYPGWPPGRTYNGSPVLAPNSHAAHSTVRPYAFQLVQQRLCGGYIFTWSCSMASFKV